MFKFNKLCQMSKVYCANNMIYPALRVFQQKLPLINKVNELKKCLANGDIKLSQSCQIYKKTAFLAFGLFRAMKKNEPKSEKEKEIAIENQLAHVIAMAELALKDNDVQAAESILGVALGIAEENKVHVGVSCVYDMLATIAFHQGQIKKAEQFLVKIIERLIQLGYPEDENTIINFKLKLSRIYTNMNQDTLAELGFKNCLSAQAHKVNSSSKIDEETDHLYVSILFWYGKFLLDKGRWEEARKLMETAYSHSERVKGIKPSQEMVLLYYLSDLCFSLKDYDVAVKHIMNALVIGKNTNNPDTPHYFTKLGIIYMFKGMYDKARLWCNRAGECATKLRNIRANLEAAECIRQLDIINK